MATLRPNKASLNQHFLCRPQHRSVHLMYSAVQFMYMLFLNPSERAFLKAVVQFAYCNPFLPEHTEFERAVLGPDFIEGEPVWSQQVNDPEKPRENVWRIFKKLEPVANDLRRRLARRSASPSTEDLVLYEDAILHLLYQRYYPKILYRRSSRKTHSPPIGPSSTNTTRNGTSILRSTG